MCVPCLGVNNILPFLVYRVGSRSGPRDEHRFDNAQPSPKAFLSPISNNWSEPSVRRDCLESGQFKTYSIKF